LVARVDGGSQPERDRDRIRGARVDAEDFRAAADDQLREVRVVDHPGDEYALQGATQPGDHGAEQVVRERTRELHSRELHGDRTRLARTDPDRQHPRATLLLEDHDRGVRGTIQTQTLYRDFNHVA